MEIAVAITHDKGTDANRQQITALMNRLTWTPDENHPLGGYCTNANLPAHRFYIFQIVPDGIAKPSNFSNIPSINVYYAPDKPSPNYLLWAIKRAIEYGADAGIYVDDISALTVANLRAAIDRMQETNATISTEPFGKIAVKKYLLGRTRHG